MEEIKWGKGQLKNEQTLKNYRSVSITTNSAILNVMNAQ